MELIRNNDVLPPSRTSLTCRHQDPLLFEVDHIDVGREWINIELHFVAELVRNNDVLPPSRTSLTCPHQDPLLFEADHIDVGGEWINIELHFVATPENQPTIVYHRLHLATKVIAIVSVLRECTMPFATSHSQSDPVWA
jgi:hypothetical protein